MHDFHTHFIPTDVINWLKENKNTVNAEWIKKEKRKKISFSSIKNGDLN